MSRPDSVDDRMTSECGAIGGTGKRKKALEENPLQCRFVHHSRICSDLGLNPDCRGGKPTKLYSQTLAFWTMFFLVKREAIFHIFFT